MKRLCMLFYALSQFSCQSGVVPIAQRGLYEKEGKNSGIGNRRPVTNDNSEPTELYIKKDSLTIAPKEKQNFSGSLFALADTGNFLYSAPPRGLLGEYLDVAIDVNRSSESKKNGENASDNTSNSEQLAEKNSKQDELIAALPKLAPASIDARIPVSIKMRVIREMENGDVVVEASRSSNNDLEARTIRILSVIPRKKIVDQKPISTMDLQNVVWEESINEQVIRRDSSLWEDEYSLRWAGFDEARSKAALDLENKRRDLEKVRARMEERILNSNKERQKIAAERTNLDKNKSENEQKILNLKKQIDEQQALLELQKEENSKRDEAQLLKDQKKPVKGEK